MEGDQFVDNENFESTKNDERINLKTQWGDFRNAILNPFTVLLLIGTLFLLWLQARTVSNVWFSTVLTLLTGLIIGLAISRFDKLYTHIQERRPMIRRGMIAIRRLGALIENVRLLESRIAILQEQLKDNSQVSPAVMKTNLEELRNFCFSIQLSCFSSIEDWTEILPHTSIATLHSQVIAKFLQDREAAMESVRSLNDELARFPDQSTEEMAELKARISVKEQEVSLLNDLLFNSRTEGLWTTFTPEPATMRQTDSGEMYIEKCRVCGESYYTTTKDRDPWGRCTRCKSERKMPQL